jgi:hypothetical protein
VTLTLKVSKEIQAVGIAFNLINIRVANLRNELDAAWIMYNVNDGAATPGLPIKFAAVSGPSDKKNSTFSSSQRPQENSRAIDRDNRSSI